MWILGQSSIVSRESKDILTGCVWILGQSQDDQWTKVAKPDVAILHTKKQSTLEETMIVHLISQILPLHHYIILCHVKVAKSLSRYFVMKSASLDQNAQMAFLDFHCGSPPWTKVAKSLSSHLISHFPHLMRGGEGPSLFMTEKGQVYFACTQMPNVVV